MTLPTFVLRCPPSWSPPVGRTHDERGTGRIIRGLMSAWVAPVIVAVFVIVQPVVPALTVAASSMVAVAPELSVPTVHIPEPAL